MRKYMKKSCENVCENVYMVVVVEMWWKCDGGNVMVGM